jgi:deoxyribodipyrimidine photolyase-related protein
MAPPDSHTLSPTPLRHLILVLGDQLDRHSQALTDFDPARDAVWMAEVQEEATYVWSHKLRLVYFLAAMRHFRDELRAQGRVVHYHALTPEPVRDRGESLAAILAQDIKRLQPQKLVLVRPGDFRVLTALTETAKAAGIPLEMRPDRHFLCTVQEFQELAAGGKQLRQEHFYRRLRRRYGLLLDQQGRPLGGRWNFDQDNRQAFGRQGPPPIPAPRTFPPDALTREVIALVRRRFPHHPGSLDQVVLPVTSADAETFLQDFIDKRLPYFGTFEDAMWLGEPVLYHSRLSAPLNLKLLQPRRCVEAAVTAYAELAAPLNSVEAFVRQILGWREYIRGRYWQNMPAYQDLNFFDHQGELPACFWDGNTAMRCFRESMAMVLAHGYTHHIHRLMVLGLFALLYGVHPQKFHAWHLAMYVDAVDWVSLPNTLGMSQYADGGIVGSKPYCASGNYIRRMSNFCAHCEFDPTQSLGAKACPFTTLYWEFLDRQAERLKSNARLAYQLRALTAKRAQPGTLATIRRRAEELRRSLP